VIVLDTNVVSEMLRLRPEPRVLSWASRLGEPTALTSVTAWELQFGLGRMPEGRRREQLTVALERVLHDASGSILAFDEAAARCAASMRVDRERVGRPVATADVQIAGICQARRATLATRNTKDFEGLGVDLVNPWDSAA